MRKYRLAKRAKDDLIVIAQGGHFLAIEQAGDESETFFHNIALLPGH